MDALTLNAQSRTALGRQSKTVRENKQIPAVMYGHGTEARALTLPAGEFRKVYAKAGSSSLVDVAVDGATPIKAIIKEVQPHYLTMEPQHVDLHQIRMDEKMHARIPLVFTGESAAVKGLGGTLVKSLDAVEIECLPADLPHEITVDISKLVTFDDAVTVGDLALSKGVDVITDARQTIATVEAPLTEEQLKKMDEDAKAGDVTAVKTEAEVKKAEEDAKKAEEEKAAEAAK